ncbi:MAG: sugar transferase [bacterium]
MKFFEQTYFYYFLKVIVDFLLIVASGFGVFYWRFDSWEVPFVLYLFLGIFILIFILLSYLRRDYMPKIPRDALDSFFSTVRTFILSYLLALVAVIFTIPSHPSRLALGGFLGVGLLLIGLHRYLFNRYLSKKLLTESHRVLIAGAGEVGRRVTREMKKLFGDQIEILGFIDDHREEFEFPILGELSEFEEKVKQLQPDSLFISISNIEEEKMLRMMERARSLGLPVKIISDVFDIVAQKVTGGSQEKWPVIEIQDTPVRRTQAFIKRGFDLVGASLILLGLSPFFVLIAAAIKLESSGPVFFTQERMKNRNESFDFIKFRTMYENAEQMKEELMDENEKNGPIFKMKKDPRITRVGKFLRRFSLDEFPQLFNVLKGDMSLVGPRPPTPDEVVEYEPWQEKRLEGYAGMTGLWQVSGRSNLEFEDMCLLDIYYLENWSLELDIKILLKTIPAVLTGKGAY